ALHDPTEGGLASGLHELATAAPVALRIDRSQVCWFEPDVAVCAALGVDPWATIASGSLLATLPTTTQTRRWGSYAPRDTSSPCSAKSSGESGSRREGRADHMAEPRRSRSPRWRMSGASSPGIGRDEACLILVRALANGPSSARVGDVEVPLDFHHL